MGCYKGNTLRFSSSGFVQGESQFPHLSSGVNSYLPWLQRLQKGHRKSQATRTMPGIEVFSKCRLPVYPSLKSCGKTLLNHTGHLMEPLFSFYSHYTAGPGDPKNASSLSSSRSSSPGQGSGRLRSLGSESSASQDCPAPGVKKVGGGGRRAASLACAAQWGGDPEAMGRRAQSTQGWRRGTAKDARSRARDRRRPGEPSPRQPRRWQAVGTGGPWTPSTCCCWWPLCPWRPVGSDTEARWTGSRRR